MIVIKIVTGEEIIGKLDSTPDEFINLVDPMYIVDYQEGQFAATQLNDCMMLSDEDMLSFRIADVITRYKPTQALVNYYAAACEYKKRMKGKLHNQIQTAADALNETLQTGDRQVTFLGQTVTRH